MKTLSEYLQNEYPILHKKLEISRALSEAIEQLNILISTGQPDTQKNLKVIESCKQQLIDILGSISIAEDK